MCALSSAVEFQHAAQKAIRPTNDPASEEVSHLECAKRGRVNCGSNPSVSCCSRRGFVDAVAPAANLPQHSHLVAVWSRTRSAGRPIVYRNNHASLIELVRNQIPDDHEQIPTHSSSGIHALDGRTTLRSPSLLLWGSERWGAMFGSVGWRIHCVFTKGTTRLSRIAFAPSVRTNATCSLNMRHWARSPPSYVVVNA